MVPKLIGVLSVCPGCGLQRPSLGLEPDPKANAYGAQHVRQSKSTIGAAFALAGLYLAIERGFSGRQVQKMHMRMARKSKEWPRFIQPQDVGPLTVADVLAVPPGPRRDEKLMDWCASVWGGWSPQHGRVSEMVDRFL